MSVLELSSSQVEAEYDHLWQVGTPADAAEELLLFVDRIQHSPIRSEFPQKTLHIGSIRPKGRSLGHRIVSLTAGKNAHYLEGSSREIFEKLQEISNDTVSSLKDIGLIVIAYFLHNYQDSQKQEKFVKSISTHFPQAAVIGADYTFADHSAMEMMDFLTSDTEKEQLRRKGEDRFIEEHSTFTLESLRATFATHYPYVAATSLSAGRGVTFASRKDVEKRMEMTLEELMQDVRTGIAEKSL